MKEMNKAKFAKEIEALLRQTRACQNIEITYGSLTYEPAKGWTDGDVIQNTEGKLLKRIFTESLIPLENDDYVMIKIGNKVIYQSVEADSNWGMVLDVVKRLDKEGI